MAPKSLCLITALAPVPAFLGGSCPLGCSLSAPATGGFSVVSPRYIRYVAGSEEPVPYNGIRSGPQPFSEGLAPWVVPSTPLPQGDSLWLASSALCMRQAPRKRSGPAAHFMGYYSTIVRILQWGCGRGFPRGGWQGLGMGGLVLACALLPRGDWLGLRRCPTGPPSNVFGNRGTRCTPGGGCAPCTPFGGDERAGTEERILGFPWGWGKGRGLVEAEAVVLPSPPSDVLGIYVGNFRRPLSERNLERGQPRRR